jgi:hypothetical protein
MAQSDPAVLLHLYWRLAPGELFRLLQQQMGVLFRNGIYSARVVIWMMMNQRWQADGTLARSVEQLVQGQFDPLLSRCKRVREKRIALATGGYCQARQNLPTLLVSHTVNELLERLRNHILEESGSSRPYRAYLLDGSSLQLENCPELVRHYPPAENQYGRSHWPVVRIVVLHDLETGLAERPYWGPMYGVEAVSEQGLADLAMRPVPAGSVMVGDRNFGVFSIAYGAQQRGQGVVLRLTAERAKALAGGPISQAGDSALCWRASRWERAKRPALPAEASVTGRLIAWRVGRGKGKDWLYLFTTLNWLASEVVALYGKRWNIETDLRSLKQTVRLERLEVHSREMMEKELLVAVLAYNFIRAIMCLAARRVDLEPRQLSFTWARNIVLDGYRRILSARTVRQQERELDRMIGLVSRCRLPRRTKRRTYPRAVWAVRQDFPPRREEN